MKLKMAATTVAVVAVATGCGSSKSNDTFDVKGYVNGTVGSALDLTKGKSCKFTDATVSVGDPVVIKGALGAILGKANLTAFSLDYGPACSFKFSIPGIKAGESGYTVELDPYAPVVATESELKSDNLNLTVRGPMDVLTKPNAKPIQLSVS